MAKKRLTEISLMNLLFCLLVIWIHVNSEPITMLDRSSLLWGVLLVFWRGAAFVVQGFIFLSAFKLFLKDRPLQYGKFYWGRCKQILLPYLLAAAVYYVYFMVAGYLDRPASLLHFGEKLLIGNLVSPFYFVIIIAQFYLLMPLWRWLVRKVAPLWLILVSGAVTVACYLYLPDLLEQLGVNDFKYNDRVFTTYLIYWILGALCGKYYEMLRSKLAKARGWLVGAFVLLGSADVCFVYLNGRGIYSLPQLDLLHMAYCIAAIFGVMSLCLKVQKLPQPAALLDKSSYYVFLWHCLFIYLGDTCLRRLLPNNVALRFAGRVLIVYTLTLLLCMGYQYLKERRGAKNAA